MTEEQREDLVDFGNFVEKELSGSLDLEAIEAKAKLEERRLAIISMDIRCLIEVFNWFLNPDRMITIPFMTVGLPPDCKVVKVAINWERDCIDLMIQHKSFAIVSESGVRPRLGDRFHVRNLIQKDASPTCE